MKLYQYQGGGYDGCIWEWNFFLLDEEDGFTDIFSSGYSGIKNHRDAIKRIKASNASDKIYLYDLTKEEDIEEFSKENNSTNVGRVCDLVNTYLDKEVMFYDCSYCDKRVYPINHNNYPSYFHDENNYSGDGGIGIQFHSCICEECYHNRCDKCDSILRDDYVIIDEEHLCSYCAAEHEERDS
jgi:hypothetical protein